jgi:N6-adenosine-specific RNA methylase IME4
MVQIRVRRQKQSPKLDEVYELIERRSPGPYLELLAGIKRPGGRHWGDQAESYEDALGKHAASNACPTRARPKILDEISI